MNQIQNISVLLIEDNRTAIYKISNLLSESTSWHFDLRAVTTMADAFRSIENNSFDIILADLELPDSTRDETLYKLQWKLPESIPFIILTATDKDELMLQSIDAGAQDYICKDYIVHQSFLSRSIYSAYQKWKLKSKLSLIEQGINHSSDALAISTHKGDFYYLNSTFTDVFMYEIDEIIEREYLYSFIDKLLLAGIIKTISEEDIWQNRCEVKTKEGEAIPVFVRVSSFSDISSKKINLVWNFTNITEQKKAEEQIENYTKSIESDLEEKKILLSKARLLQHNLIHQKIPLIADFNIKALYLPCEQLGGDFFRIQRGILDNKLIIIIGDCTDHGLKASMDASLLSSEIDKYIADLYIDNRTDLFLSKVNNGFLSFSMDDQFPTVFVMIIDLDSKIACYSNANGELPLVLRNGDIDRLEKVSGMHLGYYENPSYERKILKFTPGDKLLFFSDAILEIDKKNFADRYESLRELVPRSCGSISDCFNNLIDNIERENSSLPLADDLTLILIEYSEEYTEIFSFHDLNKWKEIDGKIRFEFEKFDYSVSEVEKIVLSAHEMSINAFVHGNKADSSKNVSVVVHINCKEAVITIEDEGNGFDPDRIPDPVLNLESLLETDDEDIYGHGRGIWITRQYMDSVKYNEKGNSVVIKYQKSETTYLTGKSES